MELEEYLGHLNVDYARNTSTSLAKEIEIVEWTFEIMKLARSKIADFLDFNAIFSQKYIIKKGLNKFNPFNL